MIFKHNHWFCKLEKRKLLYKFWKYMSYCCTSTSVGLCSKGFEGLLLVSTICGLLTVRWGLTDFIIKVEIVNRFSRSLKLESFYYLCWNQPNQYTNDLAHHKSEWTVFVPFRARLTKTSVNDFSKTLMFSIYSRQSFCEWLTIVLNAMSHCVDLCFSV